MKKITLTCVALALILISCGESTKLQPLLGTIDRVVPWMNGKVVLKDLPAATDVDVFELSTQSGKLVIKANSIPAAGMGLNYYLENYCNRFYSLTGSNLAPVDVLPEIKTPVRKESPFQYRYFLNYCTHNYTYAFWDWDEWEKELDWMVLNGINLSLAVVGIEEVWYNTLLKLGYTSDEALDFLSGPAFTGFLMMGNLESWGGKVSLDFVKKRTATQKKILARMKELGNEPVSQSFYGIVPNSMKSKFPDANIVNQGEWCAFVRPTFLQPSDPFFDKVAEVYYTELKNLYGEFKFLGGEPFHEGGNREGIDVPKSTRKVQDVMRQYNPDATWVLQAWQVNPTEEFLRDLIKDKTLILDLWGENKSVWEERKGFNGIPYVWCMVSNFGGKSGLYGKMERIATEPFRALNSPYSSNLKGIGTMPEGRLNNPVLFDMLYKIAWDKEATDMKKWISQYATYRYGQPSTEMEKVWQILLATTYKSDGVWQEGPIVSTFNARPAASIDRVSCCGTTVLYYDYKEFKEILPPLLKAVETFADVDAFRYDLVDFTRQLIANEGRQAYNKMDAALKAKNGKEFERWSAKFVELMNDQEELLSCHKDFMVGTWIDQARRLATNEQEQKLMEWNARTQISYWGPNDPNTGLNDYASKEWSGLLKDLYLPRWQQYIEVKKRQLKGEKVAEPNYFAMEKAWSEGTNRYPTEPTKPLVETAVKLLNKINH
ncbi:alpha-N-acetylglucosaminidase [Bacteroidia bacterium]|nr:alpha-N-acetylglucosaminidase [Bacteroidia bacterium]